MRNITHALQKAFEATQRALPAGEPPVTEAKSRPRRKRR